jgi:hypothetical protein
MSDSMSDAAYQAARFRLLSLGGGAEIPEGTASLYPHLCKRVSPCLIFATYKHSKAVLVKREVVY